MKGIFTLITTNQTIIPPPLRPFIDQGLSYLAHRGKHKQYQGFCVHSNNENMGMGLSSSNVEDRFQSDGINYIAFDGTLHNSISIKEKLQIKNEIADADLILAAYNQWGEEAFSFLEGYFSLCFFDTKRKKLYALRDPFGVRPLFFAQSSGFIAIASEIRAIYSVIPEIRNFNRSMIFDFLVLGNIARHSQQFFPDIIELKPAHFLVYSFEYNTLKIKPYYALPYRSCVGRFETDVAHEAVVTIKQLFFNGIEKHIKKEKTLAVGLSGGLDSSSLCCSIAALYKDFPLTAFTITNECDDGESLLAERIINKTNTKWVKVLCTSRQLLDELEDINYYHNIPIFNASSFAQYKLMESAHQHGFTSLMDGQGSDEMFAGYNYYFISFINELSSEWMCKDWIRESKCLSNANLSYKYIVSETFKNYFKQIFGKKISTALSRKSILSCIQTEARQSYFHQEGSFNSTKETLNDYLYESYIEHLPHILRWGEHSAARFGMDCLMPFADNKALTEYVFNIPSIYKIHSGFSKFLLRGAMKDIVPDEIRLNKQKLGFYTPDICWISEIANDIKHRIKGLPDPENIINKDFIIKNWDTLFRSNDQEFKRFIFRCFSYLVWRNTWE